MRLFIKNVNVNMQMSGYTGRKFGHQRSSPNFLSLAQNASLKYMTKSSARLQQRFRLNSFTWNRKITHYLFAGHWLQPLTRQNYEKMLHADEAVFQRSELRRCVPTLRGIKENELAIRHLTFCCGIVDAYTFVF